MTVTTQDKLNNYSNINNQHVPLSDREIEARALLSCASRLRDALEDQGHDKKAYGDAIRYNQRLWTMFQVALCEPDNQLPKHLKTILLNLGRYVDKVSFRAVETFSPHLVNSLIDINRMIAEGLCVKPPQAQSAAPVQSSAPAAAPPVPPTSIMTSA